MSVARNKTVETIEDHTSLKAPGVLVVEYYLFSLIYSWSHMRYKAPTDRFYCNILFELVMRFYEVQKSYMSI